MTKNNFLCRNYTFSISDVDRNKRVTAKHLLEILQDMATQHADALGIGFDALRPLGKVWVLSKIRIDLLKSTMQGDTVSVKTWPLAPNRFYADRAFAASDNVGNGVFTAYSRWCILDNASRLAVDPQFTNELFGGEYLGEVISNNFAKVNFDDTFTLVYNKTVRFCDLDINNHVNNTNYAVFAVNASMQADSVIRSIQMSFHRETHLSESIEVYAKEVDSRTLVVGKVAGELCFTSVLEYAKEETHR
jgi:acyl-ACP thioesterase